MEGADERYEAVHDPISKAPPTKQDLKNDAALKTYMDVHMQLETTAEMNRRNEILAQVKVIFCQWVRHVAVEVLHIPEEEAAEAGGELFISGSHKLGVREPNADIDTVCVAPHFVNREHFFTSLKEILLRHPDVKDLNAIDSAAIPLISFDFRGVSIDLLFAQLARNAVPKDLDILDDSILRGVDEATEKSLNGPRVTNMLTKLIPQAFDSFLIVLRCIRKWAKCRGIYGNKLGYLGGVNCNILVALICQLYPFASPSSLIYKFFVIYSTRNWETTPVQLNKIQGNAAGESKVIWSRENNFDVMAIITPAYPAMNSSYSVSSTSLAVMVAEFKRGRDVVRAVLESGGQGWDRLFKPSEFFVKYAHYLACNIVCATESGNDEAARAWRGFVESRLRKFPSYLSADDSLTCIHLHSVVFQLKEHPHTHTYFIGFNVNHSKLRGSKTIHLDETINRFWNSDLRKFNGEQMDFTVEHLKWGYLPREVFESVGGVEAAKAMRAELAEAVRSERKQASDERPESEGPLGVTEDTPSRRARKRWLTVDDTQDSFAEEPAASAPRLLLPAPRGRPGPARVPVVLSWTVLDAK